MYQYSTEVDEHHVVFEHCGVSAYGTFFGRVSVDDSHWYAFDFNIGDENLLYHDPDQDGIDDMAGTYDEQVDVISRAILEFCNEFIEKWYEAVDAFNENTFGWSE